MEADELELRCENLSELPECACRLLEFAGEERLLLFKGEMGAGKTTFIRAICEELGVRSAISSPTFALVNEYESPRGVIFHFDFYRLKNEREALDIGVEEYLDSDHYCLIEWPEKIEGLLPAASVEINIVAEATFRRIKLRKFM